MDMMMEEGLCDGRICTCTTTTVKRNIETATVITAASTPPKAATVPIVQQQLQLQQQQQQQQDHEQQQDENNYANIDDKKTNNSDSENSVPCMNRMMMMNDVSHHDQQQLVAQQQNLPQQQQTQSVAVIQTQSQLQAQSQSHPSRHHHHSHALFRAHGRAQVDTAVIAVTDAKADADADVDGSRVGTGTGTGTRMNTVNADEISIFNAMSATVTTHKDKDTDTDTVSTMKKVRISSCVTTNSSSSSSSSSSLFANSSSGSSNNSSSSERRKTSSSNYTEQTTSTSTSTSMSIFSSHRNDDEVPSSSCSVLLSNGKLQQQESDGDDIITNSGHIPKVLEDSNNNTNHLSMVRTQYQPNNYIRVTVAGDVILSSLSYVKPRSSSIQETEEQEEEQESNNEDSISIIPTKTHRYLLDLENNWNKRMCELCAYLKNNRSSSSGYNKQRPNQSLRSWINSVREMYKHNGEGMYQTLTKERIQLLNDLGFVWTYWEMQRQNLIDYKEQNGTTNVPKNYSQDKTLAQWVANQRCNYKLFFSGKETTTQRTTERRGGSMTTERILLLENIGFDWCISEEKPKQQQLKAATSSIPSSSISSSVSSSTTTSTTTMLREEKKRRQQQQRLACVKYDEYKKRVEEQHTKDVTLRPRSLKRKYRLTIFKQSSDLRKQRLEQQRQFNLNKPITTVEMIAPKAPKRPSELIKKQPSESGQDIYWKHQKELHPELIKSSKKNQKIIKDRWSRLAHHKKERWHGMAFEERKMYKRIERKYKLELSAWKKAMRIFQGDENVVVSKKCHKSNNSSKPPQHNLMLEYQQKKKKKKKKSTTAAAVVVETTSSTTVEHQASSNDTNNEATTAGSQSRHSYDLLQRTRSSLSVSGRKRGFEKILLEDKDMASRKEITKVTTTPRQRRRCMRCIHNGAPLSQAIECRGARYGGRDVCEYFDDHKKGMEKKTNQKPLQSEEEETSSKMQKDNVIASGITTNEKNSDNNRATAATSIRIFRRHHDSQDHSNSNTIIYPQHTHVNLVSSDLNDCLNGNDVLQKAMQLAKTYNSFLFSFDDEDGELANKIRNNEKRITYNFHNLDPTSSQFKAMTIHDILKVKRNRYGPGRETVQIEMAINDVIQRTSDLQHESFIIC